MFTRVYTQTHTIHYQVMIGSTKSHAGRVPVQGTTEFDIESHREELESIADSDLPANWIAEMILEEIDR